MRKQGTAAASALQSAAVITKTELRSKMAGTALTARDSQWLAGLKKTPIAVGQQIYVLKDVHARFDRATNTWFAAVCLVRNSNSHELSITDTNGTKRGFDGWAPIRAMGLPCTPDIKVDGRAAVHITPTIGSKFVRRGGAAVALKSGPKGMYYRAVAFPLVSTNGKHHFLAVEVPGCPTDVTEGWLGYAKGWVRHTAITPLQARQ